jgi:hypothetical protein
MVAHTFTAVTLLGALDKVVAANWHRRNSEAPGLVLNGVRNADVHENRNSNNDTD